VTPVKYDFCNEARDQAAAEKMIGEMMLAAYMLSRDTKHRPLIISKPICMSETNTTKMRNDENFGRTRHRSLLIALRLHTLPSFSAQTTNNAPQNPTHYHNRKHNNNSR